MKGIVLAIVFMIGMATLFGAGNAITGAGGRIHGNVYGFNVYDELIPISWASISATQDGRIIDRVYSSDGFYEMYLPSGTFDLVIESPGYFSEIMSIALGDGSDYALNFYLERNNQPIPEFPKYSVYVMSVVIIAIVLLITKRNKN